jgi:hypothetical protein
MFCHCLELKSDFLVAQPTVYSYVYSGHFGLSTQGNGSNAKAVFSQDIFQYTINLNSNCFEIKRYVFCAKNIGLK